MRKGVYCSKILQEREMASDRATWEVRMVSAFWCGLVLLIFIILVAPIIAGYWVLKTEPSYKQMMRRMPPHQRHR